MLESAFGVLRARSAPSSQNRDADIPPFAGGEDGWALAQGIVDTIREPLLVLDGNLRIVAASRSFYGTFRVSPMEVEGQPVYALGDGQWDIPELRNLLERILPRDTVMDAYQVEHDFVGIGRRTMLLNARAIFDKRGGHTLILLAFDDITERRASERAAADLLAQKEILLQEMQHRIANSLQIIASILLLKARAVRSEETRLHLREAHQRVMSVAAVQRQLHASPHGERIDLAPYLSRLCEGLAASMIGEGGAVRVTVDVDNGTATSTAAVSIGLIVTELVINALKHAFPFGRADGVIAVGYAEDGTGWQLSVSDNGQGDALKDSLASKPGLGTGIVQALAKQLGGTVLTTMGSTGTAVTITRRPAA